ncbi:MAG TPA: NUDIX domain-containing protein [Gemmatimonadales bacterium]|nr:NUDIX domain-containing protein [Gemmatimonadales bacterium]
MSRIRVAYIDAYVLRPVGHDATAWEVLALRRAGTGRCAGSWETVHGAIEPGETPTQAALREMREETGLVPQRLYNVSRVESFYQHRDDEVALIPVFAALVPSAAEARVSAEHDAAVWLTPSDAAVLFSWPRERRALEDVVLLFRKGDGGLLEDVLRVC